MKENSNIKILVTLIIIFCTPGVLSAFQPGKGKLPDPFVILPKPKNVEILKNRGLDFGKLEYLSLNNGAKRPVMGNLLNHLKCNDQSAKKTLSLEISDDENLPDSKEAYVLTIIDNSAKIVARHQKGLFYGCQTLQQLLEDSRDYETTIPSCKITDFPVLSYRAVQIDVKHHLDHMHTYYEAIDRLSRYKINAVIFEFEDKLRYQRQPLVGAQHAISIKEMAALTKYASERNIEITPLVQGLGHASFILKHQEYEHLRELKNNRWAFCPLHEGTYQVLFDLYRDAIEATPGSRYLHIGGDEIGNIGLCPRCKPMADEQGLLSLNIYWLNRVFEFALDNGRIPIFWDDMPLKEAGVYRTTSSDDMTKEQVNEIWNSAEDELQNVLSAFPDSCVFMRWNYTTGTQPGNVRALEWYQENHLDVMIATAAQSGPASLFPFDVRTGKPNARGIPAIKSFIELAAEREIDGMLCTAWDDRSPHMETHWRGYLAAAQYSWAPGELSLEDYDKAYLQREYGTSAPGYENTYSWLRKAAGFWEGAFNKTGNRMDITNALLPLPGIAHFLDPEEAEKLKFTNVDYTEKLIDLPDMDHPGQWSEKYKERLDKAEEISNEYTDISEKLETLYCDAERNHYHWKVFLAVNDFQITAPHLLLALKKCDTNDPEEFKQGINMLKNSLEEFHLQWDKLKNVYSETRFISYPPHYVQDRYYHFASQREDLSWMIQVEQLFHEMIHDWIKDNSTTQ